MDIISPPLLMKIPQTRSKDDDGNKDVHTSRLTGPCLLIEVNQKPIWCLLSHRRTAPNKVIKTHGTAPVPRHAYLGNARHCGKMDRNYLGNSALNTSVPVHFIFMYFFFFTPPTSVSTMASSIPLAVFICLRSVLFSSALI